MLSSILSFLGGVSGLFGKVVDYMNKRNTENLIKNNYEKDKEIAALEETAKTDELVKESEEKFEAAKETIENIADVKLEDAELSKKEIKEELESIEDPEEKKQREAQIELAKEIKEAAAERQEEIEKDEKFNSGDEINFKG